MMKHTIFGDKKTLQIVSPQTINEIKSLIKNIGSFNIDSKYYSFLNRKNIGDLKEGNYSVSLSTFGKKFVMFITNYKNKKYCLFINKKNETMTIVQLKFSNEIFDGSLFEGELVKNEDEKWIFLINDVMYYKGKNIVTNDFNKRQEIINDFLDYKKIAVNRTITIYRNNENIINPEKFKRSKKDYHIDHLFSIKQGFLENLPIEIISHPCNLHMIFYMENLKKQDVCWITKEDLLNNIILYNNDLYLKQKNLKQKYSNIKEIAKQILDSISSGPTD